MKIRLVLLFTALRVVSAFGQDAKVAVVPPEVVAGKNITITLTLDRAPSADSGAIINISLAPKDKANNPAPNTFNLFANDKEHPNVYGNTVQIPNKARGVWYVSEANTQVSGITTPIELSDHPEVTVKPIEIILPKTGRASITVP